MDTQEPETKSRISIEPNNTANNRPSTLNVESNSPKKRNDNKNKSKNKKKNEAKRKNVNKKSDTKDKSEKLSPTKASPDPTSSTSPNLGEERASDTSNYPTSNYSLISKPEQSTKTSTPSENSSNSTKKHLETKTRELREQLSISNSQIQTLIEQLKQQKNKTKELEAALVGTTKTCNQLEKLLQQELSQRIRLESEIESLEQTIGKLKAQIATHEKNKFNTDELMRVLNATLMERETEVSILKLKLTKLQTNPSSIVGINSSLSSIRQPDPVQSFASNGRSNSEFDRSSYARSTMRADLRASATGSISQLRSCDKDASVWAAVPEELTPSKRPQVLEENFQSLFGDSAYNPYGNIHSLVANNMISPITRDRRYRTLPRSMKSPSQEFSQQSKDSATIKPQVAQDNNCKITNLDDSNSTSQSSPGNKTLNSTQQQSSKPVNPQNPSNENMTNNQDINIINLTNDIKSIDEASSSNIISNEPVGTNDLPNKSTPKKSSGMKKILHKFRLSDLSGSKSGSKGELDNNSPVPTPEPSPFKRNAARSTMVGAPKDIRAQMSSKHAINFQSDKPFAEWDTEMLVDWLNMIGLSMYATQCQRWVKCGAHIMNATPAEVDKGLGITNHLHRKKLRLAISELNGDCDKITKSAAKLDYLWVARWLDDMGLPQYKEAFINARVDGRVLNYLTVEDLVSLGVKSILHHASIRCGIKVLRSIQFDLQLLKRRATADEVEQMNSLRQQINQISDQPLNSNSTNGGTDNNNAEIALWTCHRVMEWLRMIDFAEFAPNLRGSGVHGGLIMFEDGFNVNTMCSLLSIPASRTLLRRHLAGFFKELIGEQLTQRKNQHKDLVQLNPSAEIKTPKKSLWFSKLKTSKVAQDVSADEYLCPMYPVEPQLIKTNDSRRNESTKQADNSHHHLARIPESINI